MNANNFVSSENQNGRTNLTPEKLRTYKGFENISDDEALIQIEIIKKLARILKGIYIKQNGMNNSE
jgi:hypothetical protein